MIVIVIVVVVVGDGGGGRCLLVVVFDCTIVVGLWSTSSRDYSGVKYVVRRGTVLYCTWVPAHNRLHTPHSRVRTVRSTTVRRVPYSVNTPSYSVRAPG